MQRSLVNRLAAATFLMLAPVLAADPPRSAAEAATAGPTELTAQVDRRPVAGGTERDPIRLRPDGSVAVKVRLRNAGGTEVTVRTVRLEGRVMGLVFFAYDTQVDLAVPPQRSRTLRYAIDLAGLRGQATGLIPGRVVALGPDRHELASQATVFDVRGSLASVYGAFGLAVAGFTALSLTGALLALARHRLSANRWRRGMRFCWAGLGIGLLIVFGLSAFRVFVPQPGRWVPIVLACTAALFAVGYLTPTPPADDESDADEDLVDDPAALTDEVVDA